MRMTIRFFVFALVSLAIVLGRNAGMKMTGHAHTSVKGSLHESEPPADWFARQRAFPFDEVPEYAHQAAFNYVRHSFMKSALGAVYDQLAWTLAGPSNIEGRVTSVVIHPTDPNTVFVGTANGGVWKSTDFCTTWVSLFDNMNTQSIGCLAIDSKNPNVLYCGTGFDSALEA